MKNFLKFACCLLAAAWSLAAQRGWDRYAVLLEEPPLAAQVSSRKELRTAAAVETSARIEAAQQRLRQELARRNIRVAGAVNTLLNAVFVRASEEQLDELRSLPGVRRVAHLPPMRRHLDEAVQLVGAPQAWNLLGGTGSAGAGVKIGIIDTGIDHEHAAFQDASLSPPAGFPKCRQADCAYTNNKVIVARSYVDMLVWGHEPAYSRPDDLSPRDRVGHGTATAMIAAGVPNSGPAASITGVAPMAFLGNYKIFGSPGVNDSTYGDVLIEALEDAFNDGMDIVTLSVGSPGLYGPLDSFCGDAGLEPCDVRALAVEIAARAGMAVVVSAGNDGDLGNVFPTLNSLHTPGTAPAAITVGASTNSHVWFSSVRTTGTDVPSGLRDIPARFGDGPKPAAPLTAPLRDVSRSEPDGLACSPLATGSLTGTVALVQRGTCAFVLKVHHAREAGAVGVIIYQVEGSDYVFSPMNLIETAIPAVMIGNTDGRNLKAFLAAHPDREVTLDPALRALTAEYDTVADFSSRGPAIGDSNIKPDLVAVGTDLYTATQRYDPNSDMYSPDGYTAIQGTSFSVPLVAGAAALVKQRNPSFLAAQLKSAVVNTATQDVRDDGAQARVTAVGAGKLNAEAAVRTNVTLEPATLAFGVLTQGALPMSRTLKIANGSSNPLVLAVAPRDQDPNLRLTPSPSSVDAGATTSVSVRLEGTPLPPPGAYEGAITIKGGTVDLRVPYLYLVGDGAPHNIFPILGFDFVGNVSELIPGGLIGFKLIDRYGVPVRNAQVAFRVTLGGGSIDIADRETDIYGIAAAEVRLGPQLGEQEFTAEAGGMTVYFPGRARLLPSIETNGVVNAASYERGKPVAPGSYIAIFGRGLSETTRVFSTSYLPLSLAGVSVSFDVPAKNLSLPGRLHFVSDGQVNVQVPWELQGLNTAWIKVSIGYYSSSSVYALPLADYSPAFFEYAEPSSGRQLIAALDENNGLVGSGNPAQRGGVVQLYANGLGPVDNQPPSGEITPLQPLAQTRLTPTVTVGGRQVAVQFSGLAPYNVGLYQINVEVPPDAPTGLQPVVITTGGVTSKAANLPIQ